MNIFRKLGCGLSKLSIHKKGSSKSKSKARRCEAKSDGLTYNSPFGASFRRDPGHDLSYFSFVSPETSANCSLVASAEDFDGLDGSVSSFDKPFVEQANEDDLGRGSLRRKSDFKPVYRKSVDARNGGDPDRTSRQGKSSRAGVHGSESTELDSFSHSQKAQTAGIKSQQRTQNPSEYFKIEFDSSIDGGNELGAKFHPEDLSNSRNSETKARAKTSLGSNLLDTNLDSLKSSIEEIIGSGLEFKSSYKAGSEAAKQLRPTSRDRSILEHRRPVGNTSTPNHNAGYVWSTAEDVVTFRVRKPMSSRFESLGNMLSLPDFPDDAQEEPMNILKDISVGKRGSLRRRSNSLSEIDRYQRSISFLSSRRGADLSTKAALETLQTTLKSPRGQQIGSFQQDVALEKSVGKRVTLKGKRPSELRTRRLAAIMCPRPYGLRNTAHENHSSPWDIKISDRRSSPCSGEVCESVRSCCIPTLYTTSGLPVAVKEDSACGDELRQLSNEECLRKYTSTVDKQMLGFRTVESPDSVISSRESGEETLQPFQESTNFQDSAHIMSPYVSEKIHKTVSSELCIKTKPTASETSPTSSHRGGNFWRHSMSKSVHENVITQFQQTATPDDILQKYSDLEEIKFYEPSKMASVQPILNDGPSFEMTPPVSSVAMTDPRSPSHDQTQPRFGQVFAARENSFKLEHPFSYSSCIFFTKEAILRQSRKGWSTRCNQDSD